MDLASHGQMGVDKMNEVLEDAKLIKIESLLL
jgi:hypothetical protein